MKKFITTAGALIIGLSLFSQPQLELETFATGFNRLTDITHCGDDRLFVLERDGRIRIIEADGEVRPVPFLDINPRVGSAQSEQGLLGLAFHPDYLDNGFFFVYYTDNDGDSQLSRFSVSDSDPNVADPDSELKIFDTHQPYWNHNGGCIKFGPDGYLYLTLGDGGSGGDPENNGQNRLSFLGKMLRIDVDNGTPYAIPPDNPFANDDFTLDEIWAIGLRNAWRFSFDRVTGDMWIGDVGQNAWEEINFQPADSPGGENYGWRCYEANHPFNTNGCADMSTMTFPVFEYANSFSQGCSVTGGFVYRGCQMPALYGHYLFTDFCSGKFWSITPDNTGWKTVELANFNDNIFSSFGENSAGELFVVGHGNGRVYKITSDSDFVRPTPELCAGANDGTLSLTIPTDQLVEIIWSDGSIATHRTGLAPGTYSVTVTTANNCTFNTAVTIEPGLPGPDQPVITVSGNGLLMTDVVAASYQWFLNGNPISGATGSTWQALENGEYVVVAANANGCESASDPLPVTLTNALERLGLRSVSVTPNPFDKTFLLQIRTDQRGGGPIALELSLFDIGGQQVLRRHLSVNGFFEKTYSLQKLPPGVYLLSIKNENGEWGSRVVKKN